MELGDGEFKLTGRVASIQSTGQGPNSEMLLVSVTPSAGGANVALAVYSNEEPGLVAAYATMLFASCPLKEEMDFYYNFNLGEDQPGEIFRIIYPSGSQ